MNSRVGTWRKLKEITNCKLTGYVAIVAMVLVLGGSSSLFASTKTDSKDAFLSGTVNGLAIQGSSLGLANRPNFSNVSKTLIASSVSVSSHNATIAWKNYLYLVGGSGNSAIVQKVDLDTNQLTTLAPITTAITGQSTNADWTAPSLFIWAERLYVAGGKVLGSSNLSNPSVVSAQLNSDGSLGAWRNETSLPLPTTATLGTVVMRGGYAYYIKANNNPTFAAEIDLAKIYRSAINADGTLSAWSPVYELFLSGVSPYTIYGKVNGTQVTTITPTLNPTILTGISAIFAGTNPILKAVIFQQLAQLRKTSLVQWQDQFYIFQSTSAFSTGDAGYDAILQNLHTYRLAFDDNGNPQVESGRLSGYNNQTTANLSQGMYNEVGWGSDGYAYSLDSGGKSLTKGAALSTSMTEPQATNGSYAFLNNTIYRTETHNSSLALAKYAATDSSVRVSSGVFYSKVMDLGSALSLTSISWSETLNGGSIKVYISTASSATERLNYFKPVSNGQSLSGITARYISYKVVFDRGSSASNNPLLNTLTLDYYDPSATEVTKTVDGGTQVVFGANVIVSTTLASGVSFKTSGLADVSVIENSAGTFITSVKPINSSFKGLDITQTAGTLGISNVSGVTNLVLTADRSQALKVTLPQTISNDVSLTLTDSARPIALKLTPGLFSAPTSVTLKYPSQYQTETKALGGKDLKPLNLGLEITPEAGLQPLKEVAISIGFTDQDLSGFNPNLLSLARFDPSTNAWVPLRSTIDLTSKVITGYTNHFSLFQVIEVAPSASLDSVKVYPNPFRGQLGHTEINFTNLTANASIKIFTIRGELVKEISANAQGLATWDTRNKGNSFVAGGAYLALIESTDNVKKTITIGVER